MPNDNEHEQDRQSAIFFENAACAAGLGAKSARARRQEKQRDNREQANCRAKCKERG